MTGLEISENYKKLHFWFNFVLWGFVVDVGFVVARFFKTGRYYKEIHGSVMGIIVVLTAYVEIWMAIESRILIFIFNLFN